jgi:hypothetical protein
VTTPQWQPGVPPADALETRLHDELRHGARLISRDPHTATIESGHPIRHRKHALATLLTCGLWAWGWAITCLLGGRRRFVLSRTTTGAVIRRPLTPWYKRPPTAALAALTAIALLAVAGGNPQPTTVVRPIAPSATPTSIATSAPPVSTTAPTTAVASAVAPAPATVPAPRPTATPPTHLSTSTAVGTGTGTGTGNGNGNPGNGSNTCGADHYVNSDGLCVHDPVPAPAAPAGATAKCDDGTFSFSTHRSGTCSHHGGVAEWL